MLYVIQERLQMFAFKTHFTPKPTSANHSEKSNTFLLTCLLTYLLTYLHQKMQDKEYDAMMTI